MINSDNGTEIVYRIPYSSDIIIVKIAARNKAARKRGIVYFEGELLVKGAHDMVPITLLQPPRATR